MIKRLKVAPRKIVTTGRMLLRSESIVMRWATEGVVARNWGDKLNSYLAEKISGKVVFHRADIYPVTERDIHYWIGSHLATACADPRAVIWGSGFISTDVPIIGVPRAIRAVRGWLSNDRIADAGLAAPDIVGDAALLLPRFFEPKRHLDQRSLGIIPHCFEWNEPFFRTASDWEDVRVIDICGDIEDVVEEIVSCDRIISSSLHGIICADAYGVPALWLKASDKPKGDGFKFVDYFSSVGRPDTGPILVSGAVDRAEIEAQFFDYEIRIDLDALWMACPLRPGND